MAIFNHLDIFVTQCNSIFAHDYCPFCKKLILTIALLVLNLINNGEKTRDSTDKIAIVIFQSCFKSDLKKA